MTISIFNKTNYKKSKLAKLKSFCTVIENKSSILKASQHLFISSSAISKHISSLEEDLGFYLFDRHGKRLTLNEKGAEFYKIAKNILLDLEKAYSPTLEHIDENQINKVLRIHKIEKFKKRLENCISLINKFINRMLLNITPKRFLCVLGISIVSGFYYLHYSDYWFERKLYNKASPLLKEVMKNGLYRIDSSKKCDSIPITMILHYNDLILKILNEKISLISIASSDCPNMPERMNGDDKLDSEFKNKKHIKCNIEEKFAAQKLRYAAELKMIQSGRFLSYNFYRNPACFHQNVFEENKKKFSSNIFGVNVSKPTAISDGSHFILKHKQYYYLFIHANALQSHQVDEKNQRERNFIWRKLTFDQLKIFDNGSYWKLINEYNIKID